MIERDHTVIEELLSIDALGGLDDADRALLDRERASHGADCEECARLEAGFREVAGRLGLSLEPVQVRAGMADDILREAGAPAPASAHAPFDLAERRERRAGGSWRRLVAVAAAFVLFAGGWVVRDAVDSGGGTPRLVSFAGDAGTLAVAYQPGKPGVIVFGSDLPDPGPDRAYEIWMVQGTQAPVSGGCVHPTDGRVLTYVPADIGRTDTMLVTVESSSCPSAPTTDPVLSASLT
jgi:anti-sigma-K factor RskA